MSALYVDAVGMPVTLELEGPALRLRRPKGPAGRVPLRRLSRLVIRGPAHLDGRVIPALVQAGIPLAFLDARNRPIGTLLPAMLRRTDTRALLEEAETRGLLDEVREPWRVAEERRLVLELRTGLGLVMHDLRRRTVDRRILALLDARGAPLDGEELVARMKALLDAHLAQLLLAEGLGWAWQGGDPEHWNLRADLADILILALVPDLLDLAAHLASRPERHDTPARLYRRFARRYERAAPRIARLTDALLARLRRRLREVLT